MKKVLSTLLLAMFINAASAQVSKLINVTTAGTLTTLLSATEKSNITNLTVTGNIDARDFKTLRDEITELSILDLSGVSIKAYTGNEGTQSSTSTSYIANAIPQYAFKNSQYLYYEKKITKIVIPNTITSIGNDAFYGCNKFNYWYRRLERRTFSTFTKWKKVYIWG